MRHNILITGASQGLGAALALGLAAKGVRLILWARDEEKLQAVAGGCREKGAEAEIVAFDLADISGAVDHLSLIDEQWPLDLIILNAGLFDGAHAPDALENLASEMIILTVNLKSTIALAHRVARAMRQRQSGHIVFIGSLAGQFPLADAAAYSASKAGVSAYAAALREKLFHDGIVVTEVRPGHIKTNMTMGHRGALPMLMPVETASKYVLKGIKQKKIIIAFPRLIAVFIFFSGLLPWRVRIIIARMQRFYLEK